MEDLAMQKKTSSFLLKVVSLSTAALICLLVYKCFADIKWVMFIPLFLGFHWVAAWLFKDEYGHYPWREKNKKQ